MTKKLTKDEMRHDAFRDALSTAYHTVEHRFETHWKLYLAGLGVLFGLLVAGMLTWNHLQSRKGEASFLASRVVEAFDAPVLKADDPAREGYKRQGALFFDTEAARAAEVEKRLGEAAKGPSHGPSAHVCTLYRAYAAARAGKADEALSLAAPLAADPELGPLAVMFEARVRESKRDAAGAEAAYKRLATLTGPGFPLGAGTAQLAEYYERTGDTAKAREQYAALESALKGKVADDDPLLARAKSQQEKLKGAA